MSRAGVENRVLMGCDHNIFQGVMHEVFACATIVTSADARLRHSRAPGYVTELFYYGDTCTLNVTGLSCCGSASEPSRGGRKYCCSKW